MGTCMSLSRDRKEQIPPPKRQAAQNSQNRPVHASTQYQTSPGQSPAQSRAKVDSRLQNSNGGVSPNASPLSSRRTSDEDARQAGQYRNPQYPPVQSRPNTQSPQGRPSTVSEPIRAEPARQRPTTLDSPPSFKGFLTLDEPVASRSVRKPELSPKQRTHSNSSSYDPTLDKENSLLPETVRVVHTNHLSPTGGSLESEKAEITEIMNRKKLRDSRHASRSDSDAESLSNFANRLQSSKYPEASPRQRNQSVSSNGSIRGYLGEGQGRPFHSRLPSEANSTPPSRNPSIASRAGLSPRDADSGARPAGLHATRSGTLSGSPTESGQAGADLYEFVGHLGSGGAGVMKLMRDRRSKDLVAAKWVQHTQGEALSVQLEREIVNHRRLLHPNIIRFREVFATDEHLVIVMDYASIGPLSDRIAAEGALQENITKMLFRQLVDGMVYCHRQGVVHRNLVLGNLLLDGHAAMPVVKISGFAYSKAPDLDSAPKSAVTAPMFLAPEVLLGMQRGEVYDGRASDVWACGIILFNIVTGRLPFQGDPDAGGMQAAFKATQRILSCDYEFPQNKKFSPELRDLIARIFVSDPKRRIDSYDLSKHPWLSGTQLPAAKPETVIISRQSESDISQVMERARKRREARLAAQRANSSRPENFNEDLVVE